ncbi:MAG: nucleotidyltransferase family protein [Ignisphaera sp.]|jgi:NDP-sugar pyrophosphorylase family protein|nr:nucleotidyltransferase family protein [Ignisphaera sp.]
MKAVILAGGLGKRLRPLTEDRPKILVEVCKKPILEWHIYWLSKYGFKDFVLLLGHAKEKVLEEVGSGKKYGINVAYVVEDEPLGTGGAIKNAEGVLRNEEWFLVINGDVITDLNPLLLLETLKNSDAIASIALVYMRSPYGIVKLVEGYVKEFLEKPILEYTINAGIYVMKPQIFNYLPEKGDIEVTAFPQLAKEGKLKGYIFKDAMWKSIDTIKDLEECENMLRQRYPEFCGGMKT